MPDRPPLSETTWGWLPFPWAPTLAMPWLYQGRRCSRAKPSLTLLQPSPAHPKKSKPKWLIWAGTTRGLPPLQAEEQTCQEILRGTRPLFSQIRAGTARKTAWSPLKVLCSDAPDLISSWECSSLINSTTLVWCFLFCCLIQITSYWRQGAVECSIAHLQKDWQAVHCHTQQQKQSRADDQPLKQAQFHLFIA